jgi:hypothetical protein
VRGRAASKSTRGNEIAFAADDGDGDGDGDGDDVTDTETEGPLVMKTPR